MSNLISDGLDKLFKDEDAPPIHLLAVFVMLVISAIALYPDILATMQIFNPAEYRMYHDITNSISSAMLFLVSIYLTGYNIIIINRAMKDEKTVLPEIDGAPYKVFVDFFPAQAFWIILYALLYALVAAAVYFALKVNLVYASIPVALVFMFFLPFASFILATYAESFSKKGLFNPFIVFKFLKPAFAKPLLKLALQFSPIWVIVTAFSLLTYQFNVPTKIMPDATITENFFYHKLFAMNTLSAYLEIVATFLWSYCIGRMFGQLHGYQKANTFGSIN